VFSATSRYAGLPTSTTVVTGADGAPREVTYVRRRLLPRLADLTVLSHHTVQPGERLDHLAARYAGDPAQFWRLCEATDALRPAGLELPGTRLPIAAPVRQAG